MSDKGIQRGISGDLFISKKRLIYAGLYTLGFLSFPLVLYGKKSFFKSFCDFHTRVLKLNSKGPGQVAALSFIMSLVYSSFTLPIYYFGLLKILGLHQLYEIKGVVSNSAAKTYNKYPSMQRIDQEFIFELDKTFGVTPDQTKKFIQTAFGEDYNEIKTSLIKKDESQ